MIQDPVAAALYEQTSLQALPQDYERLTRIGSWFVALAESGAGKLIEAGGEAEIYDPDSPAGYPGVLERGQIAWHTYTWDVSPPQSAFYRSLLSTTLSEFRDADLSKLNVVAGFLFSDRAQSYSVRTIRYLDTD